MTLQFGGTNRDCPEELGGYAPQSATRPPTKLMATSKSRKLSLDGLFRPRSVAVIGASRRQGAIGYQVVANIVKSGFVGPVYPVNAKSKVVHSIPTYPSVGKIPGPVDLAVLVIPAAEILKVAEACGKKGVKGLVVITAGFREIGGEGIEREERLVAIAEKYGMRIVGPNCMGIINTAEDVRINGSFAATEIVPGPVAMVSQSGALGEAILADATLAGLGVAQFASVGNRADVTAADLIEYWEDDDQVKVILLYIESFGDPELFVKVARRVSRKKPIIAVKSGRSEAGAAAAGSHTGSVAGADIAADTLMAQCGVMRVVSFREMFALAAAVIHQPPAAGKHIAIVTNAGGPGILATDSLVSSGLEMAEFSKKTNAALKKALPHEASWANPVDLIASADGERYRASLRAVIKDPAVDALLVMFVSPIMIDAEAVAQAIVDEVVGKNKPVLACIMGRSRGDEAMDLLTRNGIPVFRYPEDAARTMRMLVRRGELLDRMPGKVPVFKVDKRKAAHLINKYEDGWLTGDEAEQVLAAYGVPFAESVRVQDAGAAVEVANHLGFPVVVKAEAADLIHKTEERAVAVGLQNSDEVFAAAKDMLGRLKRRYKGVVLQVQAQAKGHREILLGMTRDPRYGPLFAAGLGGTHVEVLRDISVRIAPIDDVDPVEMFDSLKGAVLLGEFRGDPAADITVAHGVILRMQQLVRDFPQIAEVEINPFILAAKGIASVAVDARLRVAH